MIRSTNLWRLSGLATALVAAPAFAHPGGAHVHGLIEGLFHPLTGADHLLAALSVGLLAGLVSGRSRLAIPGLFAAALAAGILLGRVLGMPAWELGLAASVIVLGTALAMAPRAQGRLGTLAAGAGVLLTGRLHGHAHGAELLAGPGDGSYGLGLVAGSSLVAGAGVALAHALGLRGTRVAGMALGACGLALLAG